MTFADKPKNSSPIPLPRHDIIASVARLSFTTVTAETFLSLISSPKSAYAAVILSKSTKFSFFSFILKSLPFLKKSMILRRFST